MDNLIPIEAVEPSKGEEVPNIFDGLSGQEATDLARRILHDSEPRAGFPWEGSLSEQLEWVPPTRPPKEHIEAAEAYLLRERARRQREIALRLTKDHTEDPITIWPDANAYSGKEGVVGSVTDLHITEQSRARGDELNGDAVLEPPPTVYTNAGFIEDPSYKPPKPPETPAEKYPDLDAAKMRTARTHEVIMEVTGLSYATLFGETRVVKVLKEIFSQRDPDEIALYALRNSKDKDGKLLEDVDVVLKVAEKFFSVELDPEEVNRKLEGTGDDTFLNVGDPYEVLGKTLDRESSTTIDYEPGSEGRMGEIRRQEQLIETARDIVLGHGGDGWSGRGILGAVEAQEFYNEHGDPALRDKVADEFADRMLGLAIQAADLVETPDITSAQLDELQGVIDEINAARAAYYPHYCSLRDEMSGHDGGGFGALFPPDPSESFFTVTASFDKKLREDAAILSVYLSDVYPKLVHRYIEHIADAHLNPVVGADERYIEHYYEKWRSYLTTRGVENPESYNPFEEDSHFVDHLIGFFRNEGIGMVWSIDPALAEQMNREATEALKLAMPFKKQSKRSEYITGVFPYCDELSGKTYDRILASWSVTAHAMDHMTDTELSEFFELTIGMLNPGGIAVMYPIGHYNNGELIPRIKHILESFENRISYELRDTEDHRFLDYPDQTLIIRN